jgi:hypothetical protein
LRQAGVEGAIAGAVRAVLTRAGRSADLAVG